MRESLRAPTPPSPRLDLSVWLQGRADDDGLELLVNVDNLTDRCTFITGGLSQIDPQAPRTARITLTKRW
ncbi:MAG: hypothetical protein ACJ8GV_00215 [Luteimonas sp.]